jgi:hypothetical protein
MTLWASTVCYRDSFNFFFYFKKFPVQKWVLSIAVRMRLYYETYRTTDVTLTVARKCFTNTSLNFELIYALSKSFRSYIFVSCNM